MLTNLETVKDMLGIPASNTSGDAQLEALLPAADRAVKRYCNREFEQNTYTEYASGNNTQRITLKNTPVQSITSLYLHNAAYFGTNQLDPFDSTTLLTEGQDYVLDHDQPDFSSKSGIVFRIGTVWPVLDRINSLSLLTPYQGPCWGNIKVVYVGGYADIPMDLQAAVAQTVQFMKRTIKFGGYLAQSEKLGDYAYALMVDPKNFFAIGTTLEILSAYKEVGW